MEHAPAIDGYLMAAVFAYVLRGRLLPRDLNLQVCNENHVRDHYSLGSGVCCSFGHRFGCARR